METKKIYQKFTLWAFTLFALLLCVGARAESQDVNEPKVNNVELRGGESFADHVSFMAGDKQVEVLLKMLFDEDENTLTVSALSYYDLFGFESDVRCGAVVKFWKFHYEQLPYVVESAEGVVYKIADSFKESLKPKAKHTVFQSWIKAKGASFQMGKYQMVNDYLERVYSVDEEATQVEIFINDLFVMEAVGGRLSKKSKYRIVSKNDLNLAYNVELRRDPCRGEQENIDSSEENLQKIKHSYERLSSMQATRKDNSSQDSLNMFNNIKAGMMEQYVKSKMHSACPLVMQNVEQFNKYVDSLSFVEAYYVAPQLDAKVFYDAAQSLDRYTTHWSLSAEYLEQADLVIQAKRVIARTGALLQTKYSVNGELENAIELYRRAEANFYAITKQER